jgi:hypothetical protein
MKQFSSRRTIRILIFVAPLACAASAVADATQCRLGELRRSIEVVYANPGQAVPCEVLYGKAIQGTLETLWRASNEAGYCEAKAARLTGKLENLGWECGAHEAATTGNSVTPD